LLMITEVSVNLWLAVVALQRLLYQGYHAQCLSSQSSFFLLCVSACLWVGSLSPQGICLERVFFCLSWVLLTSIYEMYTCWSQDCTPREDCVKNVIPLNSTFQATWYTIRGFWSESPPAESWTKSGETTEHNESSSQTDMGFGLPAIMI
jgi:hypothetical protein